MKSVIDWYFRLLQLVLKGLLGVLIIPVTLQILSRYTGLIPRYIWTEEAARFLFIWIIMIGASIAVREGTHFDVDILPKPKTPRGKAASQLIVDSSILIIALVFVVYGYDYAAFGYTQTSELTGINMLTMHVAFLVSGLTWIAFIGGRIITAIAVLFGGRRDVR